MYETTLDIEGNEIDIRCHYEYLRGSKGVWTNEGQMEPDELASVQINVIELNYAEPDEKADFRPIDLPYPLERNLEQEIVESYQ